MRTSTRNKEAGADGNRCVIGIPVFQAGKLQ